MSVQPANDAQIVQLIVEASIRINAKKSIHKEQVKLENKLRKHYAKQGVKFLKLFAKFQGSFKESVSGDDIDNVFDNASPDDGLPEAIQSAVETGVDVGADWLVNELGLTEYTFNLKNPRAVKFLKDYGANRVSQLDDVSKERLRNILTNGIDNGWSYGKLATAIRKEFLDFSTKRAKLIAVTELGNAYQRGNFIVGQDLSDAGLNIEKSWLTMGDSAVTPECQANEDDGWIDVNEPHSSGADTPLEHPNCRCVERYRRVGSNIE